MTPRWQPPSCVTLFGNRGSGKSETLKRMLMRLALEGQVAVVVLDLPGTLGTDMVGHLCAKGLQKRTYFDAARFTDRVPQWPFFIRSTATDPHKRRIEDEQAIDELLQGPLSQRGLKSAINSPWIRQYSDAAGWVWGLQPTRLHISKLLKFYERGAEWNEMLDRTDAASEAQMFRNLAERDGARGQYAVETGGAYRLLEPAISSPAVYLRDGDSWDWEAILLALSQVYFDLSEVKAEAARALAIFVCNAVINACRRYFARTGKPLYVVIVLEEAGALDLVTPLIITAMQAWRKAGVSVWIVSQTIMDFEEETRETILALTDVHVWHAMKAGVDRAAEDLANPTFDPKEVFYTRERKQVAGHREIETMSSGESMSFDVRSGKLDDAVRRDERTGTHFLPEYETVVEEVYKTPQLHLQEFKTKIATLQVGECLVRDKDGVRLERVTILGEPWKLGLTAIRTRKAIEAIRSRPCYRVPASSTPPSSAPPATPPKKVRKPRGVE